MLPAIIQEMHNCLGLGRATIEPNNPQDTAALAEVAEDYGR